VASRRQVVKAGLAAIAASGSPGVAGAAVPEPVVFRAIYDDRFAQARAFARMASRREWPVRPIRGDVTRLWYEELDPRWKEGPAAIAGFTVPASLFCLDMLARDRGMRLLARTDLPGDGLVWWLIAPRPGRRA
jgi:hypothetical protein